MADPKSAVPTRQQVKKQLDRMLLGDRFRNAVSQREFLEFVVKRALEGKDSPEDIIGRKLFPGFIKDESTDVRVTASNLRKTLAKYYAREGHEDLVTIALPEPPADRSIKLPAGEAYTPVFSYNPHHEATKLYRLGRVYMEEGFSLVNSPLKYLKQALVIEPNHIDALVAMAEVYGCRFAELEMPETIARENGIAEDLFSRVMKLAPNYWRSHAAYGGFLLQTSLEKASKEFDIALELDRSSTETSRMYNMYLLRTGREEEMVQHLRLHLDTNPKDAFASLLYASALLVLRREEEAQKTLEEIIAINPSHYVARIMLMNLYGKKGWDLEIREHLLYLKATLDSRALNQFSELFEFESPFTPEV